MAEAIITVKLSPREFEEVRMGLRARQHALTEEYKTADLPTKKKLQGDRFINENVLSKLEA